MADALLPMPASPNAASEQRAAPRFALMLRAGKLVTAAGEFLCILRDASESGIKARLFHALPTAQSYSLELGNGARIAIEPVWERDGHVGFRFTEGPIDVRALIEEPSAFPRRQIRLQMEPPLPIHAIADGTVSPGLVRNISQSGAALELEGVLALRQPVQIEAARLGSVLGRVRWRRGRLHGIVFQEGFRMEQLALFALRVQRALRDKPEGSAPTIRFGV